MIGCQGQGRVSLGLYESASLVPFWWYGSCGGVRLHPDRSRILSRALEMFLPLDILPDFPLYGLQTHVER